MIATFRGLAGDGLDNSPLCAMASSLEDGDMQTLTEGEAELIKLHQHFSTFVVGKPSSEDIKLKLLEDAYKGKLRARSS